MSEPSGNNKKESLLQQIMKESFTKQKGSIFKKSAKNNPEEESESESSQLASNESAKPASVTKPETHKSMQHKSLALTNQPEPDDDEVKQWKKQLPNFQAQLDESLQTARDLAYKPTEPNTQNIIDNFLNKLQSAKEDQNKEEYCYNIFKLISVLIEGSYTHYQKPRIKRPGHQVPRIPARAMERVPLKAICKCINR